MNRGNSSVAIDSFNFSHHIDQYPYARKKWVKLKHSMMHVTEKDTYLTCNRVFYIQPGYTEWVIFTCINWPYLLHVHLL